MLINRATLRTADYPGTCAFRKSAMLGVGHYDGDVLFDNEEMIRHFAHCGCSIAYANDLFVEKRSPSFNKSIEQRPRQAYEDFGMRAKTALFLTLFPMLVLVSLWFGGQATVTYCAVLATLSVLLALGGRARGRAAQFFPIRCCCFAPLWVWERSFSTYWAFYWYFSRGGYPFGDQLLSRGIGRDWWSGGRAAARQLRS